MRNKFILLLILIGVLFSCKNKKSDENKTPLARVYDMYLYKEDIANIITKGSSKQDSIDKVKSFVDFWIREQALTKTAELNLPEEQKNVANELENYRMTLLIERYKRSFLSQNLDTLITKKQIQDFYDKHQDEFRLNKAAVKVDYIRVLSTAPNLYLVRRFYRSNLEKDKLKVQEYCKNHSALYKNFNNDWIYFKSFINTIPYTVDDVENFLRRRQYIEFKDSTYYHFVNIRNYRLKGSISPLVFVEGNIQSMLLNQRKRLLIDSLQNSIYNKMTDEGKIEIFNLN